MTIRSDAVWLAIIVIAVVCVYSNTLSSGFVYDDHRQIVENPLIQKPDLFAKALTSDVWVFKGDGKIIASNYWRPVFTGWCIVNYALFGPSPAGWHILDLLLHLGVCLLAFALLRKWGMTAFMACGITLIFAVHPVHSEPVAWISGSPDLLFGLFMLASLWFADTALEPKRKKVLPLVVALVFYALALGAKEIAIFCLPVFLLLPVGGEGEASASTSLGRRMTAILPFAGLAAVYFLVRASIVGLVAKTPEGAAGIVQALMSAPAVIVFYLRQIVFPLWIGQNYPLRAVNSIGTAGFIVPLILCAAAAYVLWLCFRSSRVQKIGLALFVLPMIPVLNICVFDPEQIVHDRYLYLPLFGFLVCIVPAIQPLFKRLWPANSEKAVLAACVLLCVPLALQTITNNGYWRDDLALWQHAVVIDPASSSNWLQLGAEYADMNRNADAQGAFTRSLDVKVNQVALTGRSRVLIKLGKLDEAIRDARQALENDRGEAFRLYQSYETLAVALQTAGRTSEAETTLRDARKKLPIFSAALTEKLSVVLYMQNRKPEALTELQSVRDEAAKQFLVDAKVVYLRLGMLYVESGNKAEARRNLQDFMTSTASTREPEILEYRRQAAEAMKTVTP